MPKQFKFLLLLISLTICFFLLSNLNIIYASPKTFTENFDSTSNGQFPIGWELVNDPGGSNCPNNWIVENQVLDITIVPGGCATNIMPSDSIWNDLGDDYTFESDVTFVSGTDHAIAFRFVKGDIANDWYDLHFTSPNDFIIERAGPGDFVTYVGGQYPNRIEPYHIKIVVQGMNIKVYVDNLLVRDFNQLINIYPHGRIALRAGGDSETMFDNIVVKNFDSGTELSVPLLKQTDALWGSQVYDSANLWAPSSPGISAWGCAMTSAAMIFQYHGITKLPDSTELNPGTLNTWLKGQPDGYVGNGLVNWLALTRLSRLAKSVNPSFVFDALEFRRVGGENKPQLTLDLQNNIPDILEEPGHFIVGKGTDGTTFSIHDPFYNRTDLSSYGNTFLSLGRFVPSHTDLSYIMLVTNNGNTLTVKDSNGNPVGESFSQQPYSNALTGIGTNGPPLKIFYYPVPETGDYKVTLSSSLLGSYTLGSYLYDISGNVMVTSLSSLLSSQNMDTFTLHFDKNNKNNSKISHTVSYNDLITDINEAYNLKQITSKAVYEVLLTAAKNAQKFSQNKKPQNAIIVLKGMELVLSQVKNVGVKSPALEIILSDIQYLEAHSS